MPLRQSTGEERESQMCKGFRSGRHCNMTYNHACTAGLMMGGQDNKGYTTTRLLSSRVLVVGLLLTISHAFVPRKNDVRKSKTHLAAGTALRFAGDLTFDSTPVVRSDGRQDLKLFDRKRMPALARRGGRHPRRRI